MVEKKERETEAVRGYWQNRRDEMPNFSLRVGKYNVKKGKLVRMKKKNPKTKQKKKQRGNKKYWIKNKTATMEE